MIKSQNGFCNAVIRRIQVLRLALPLTRAYSWRGGVLSAFDVTLVRVEGADGCIGIGEAAAVDGYSWESPDSVWRDISDVSSRLVGRRVDQVDCELEGLASAPFACAAIRGAVAGLEGYVPWGSALSPVRIAGTVQGGSIEEETASAIRLVAQGYKSLKLKIGKDVRRDYRRIIEIQSALGGFDGLRVDANQGYTYDDAQWLVSKLDNDSVEHLEQPLNKNDWDGQRKLFESADVPLMLDESIWTLEDIVTASRCADRVKVKAMKLGGPRQAVSACQTAKDLGLGVIIGNGVATQVDTFIEAVVYRTAGLSLIAEFNGFAKLTGSPVHSSYTIAGGCVVFPEDGPGDLDDAVVKQFCLEKINVE